MLQSHVSNQTQGFGAYLVCHGPDLNLLATLDRPSPVETIAGYLVFSCAIAIVYWSLFCMSAYGGEFAG